MGTRSQTWEEQKVLLTTHASLFLLCVPLLSLSAVGPCPEPPRDSSGNVYGMGRFHSIHRGTGSGQSYVLTGMHVKLLGQDLLQISLTADTMPMTSRPQLSLLHKYQELQ